MLIKYCNSESIVELEEIKQLKFGEIIVNHATKKIYSKNIEGNLTKLNPGISKLIEATEFAFTKTQIKYNNTLLKFNKDYQLYTDLVFFSLSDLEGVSIALTNPVNNYLGYQSGLLVNLEKPSFSLVDFSDIKNNLTLNSSVNQYKIAFISSSIALNPKNDYFLKPIYGYWSLLPEASNIKDFNDVYSEEIDYERKSYTLRATTKTEFESPASGNKFVGRRLEIIPLSISWDKAPTLSNDLNSNTAAVKNLNYKTKYKNLFNSVETIEINPLLHTNYVCDNNGSCYSVNLNFITNELADNCTYFSSLNLSNFRGYINFSNDNPNLQVLFENGELPSLTTNNVVFNLTIVKENNIISVTVQQKMNYV